MNRSKLPFLVALVMRAALPWISARAALGDLEEDYHAARRDLTIPGRVLWLCRETTSLVAGYWMRRLWAPVGRLLPSRGGSERGSSRRLPLAGRGRLGAARIAVRGLRRSPGFAAIVVTTLAIGIGLNTAVFTVVNAALFASLPYDATVFINMEGAGPMQPAVESIPHWRTNATLLDRVEGFRTPRDVTWTGGAEPRMLRAIFATPELPAALGVAPVVGRLFRTTEGDLVDAQSALLAEEIWRREFGARDDIAGQRITLNDASYTIVGVLPRSFDRLITASADVIIAQALGDGGETSGSARIFAWLAEGATFEAAEAQLAALTIERNLQFGRASLYPSTARPSDELRVRFLFPLAIVSLVLLIACANVANLLAARTTRRHRELAVRAALGAGRGRLLQEQLTESLVLALFAGTLGFALGHQALPLLLTLAELPATADGLPLDARVLGWTLGASLASALLAGMWPALCGARPSLAQALKTAGAPTTATRRQRRIRGGLVATQVAISLPLLFGTGLLAHSLLRLNAIAPGFDADRLLTLRILLPAERYSEEAQRKELFDRLFERIARIDGVEDATFADIAPPFPYFYGAIGIDDRPDRIEVSGLQAFVGRDFFRTLGISVQRGGWDESAERVVDTAVINESFARRIWPDQDPLGRELDYGGGTTTVVGIVDDIQQVAQRLTVADLQTYHLMDTPGRRPTIIVRASGDPAALVQPLKEQVWALDPSVPVDSVETLGERLAASALTQTPRVAARLLGAFSAVALMLACVGIVGVVTNAVSEQRREIGVRLALGADASRVRGMVVRNSMGPIALGALLGTGGAIGMGRLLQSTLYEVAPTDLRTLLVSTLALMAIAWLASWLPARRATCVDPCETLRAE